MMDGRDRVRDLVDRMLSQETEPHPGGYGHTYAVSFAACRQAEKLDDPALLAPLLEELKGPSPDRRANAAFALSHLGKNTAEPAVFRLLLQHVGEEEHWKPLAATLEWLAQLEHPEGVDLAPVVSLIHHKRWQVRGGALDVLRGAKTDIAHPALIQVLETSANPYMLQRAAAAVTPLGSERALRALEKAAHYSGKQVRDTRSTMQHCMNVIRERLQMPPVQVPGAWGPTA